MARIFPSLGGSWLFGCDLIMFKRDLVQKDEIVICGFNDEYTTILSMER